MVNGLSNVYQYAASVFGPIHITLEELENRFHSKSASKINVFCSHYTREIWICIFLCLSKTKTGKYHDHHKVIVFWKMSFSKCFLSTLKWIANVLKFLQIEEHFQKALFSWWINVGRMPTRSIEGSFFEFLPHSVNRA